MNKRLKIAAVGATVLCIAAVTSWVTFGQEKVPTGNVFTISTYKVNFARLDEYVSLVEKENKPLWQQIPEIKSIKFLRHAWGPDWTVAIIQEFENFAAIEASQKKFDALLEKKYPDQARRDELQHRLLSFSDAHTDAITVEIVNLRK